MKEAVKWVHTKEGHFVGYTVNLPLCVQANSFEEMKVGMKQLAQTFINQLQKSINEEDSFEFIEEVE